MGTWLTRSTIRRVSGNFAGALEDATKAIEVTDWFDSSSGMTVALTTDGASGLARLRGESFDVIVLDWELPDTSGVALLKQLRDEGATIPVIMLTGRTSIDDREQGLDVGADDYLTKPCEMVELEARIKAVLRRTGKWLTNQLQCGAITIDTKQQTVKIGDEELSLAPSEFAVLEFLARHENQMFSAEQLLDRVWSSQSDATELALRSVITRLRKKLQDYGCAATLETVHGFGYRLRANSQ